MQKEYIWTGYTKTIYTYFFNIIHHISLREQGHVMLMGE